jgi:hypothetical protein
MTTPHAQQRQRDALGINPSNAQQGVVPLDDTAGLLLQDGVVYYRATDVQGLGALCGVLANALKCDVWDLGIYQTPPSVIDHTYSGVYAVFDSKQRYIGYYGVIDNNE